MPSVIRFIFLLLFVILVNLSAGFWFVRCAVWIILQKESRPPEKLQNFNCFKTENVNLTPWQGAATAEAYSIHYVD